ncbi:MAG: hypothetical protein Q8P68_04115 [Candidatus Peregrinibacteria bacterium]|nr:hypothetical protein [Candidatus Peregrinibacteria bacterium]MDZ4245280.1 hypothetical protein [Candidatus Gracilibacteria bacterium]
MNVFDRNKISALTAGNGAVLDISRYAIEGPGRDMVEEGFKRASSGEKHGLQIAIKALTEGGDRVILNVDSGAESKEIETGRSNLHLGGNAVNTGIAIDEVTRSMTGQKNISIYGPLSNLMHDLMRDLVRIPIINTLSSKQERCAMPSRVNIVHQEKEIYVGSRPDFTGRMDTDLQFLKREGVLMPMSNGDFLLSSCINSPLFWRKMEMYLKQNPSATLYFQPGSVHLSKIAEGAAYLPKHLLDAGRVSILLNLNEVKGFHDHLRSNDIESHDEDAAKIKIAEQLIGENNRLTEVTFMLVRLGIKDFTITSGPGKILNYTTEPGRAGAVSMTSPTSRIFNVDFLRSIGIDVPSENVLSTGCGDTFTGAFIALSKIYPKANKGKLLQAASLFAAIQTHNPGSNLSNLKLNDAVKQGVVNILGPVESKDIAA